MTTTEGLRTRMDTAAERAEAEKAKLYRPDGSKVYGEEEHAERVAGIAEEVARVAEEVRAGADRIIEEKRADLDAIVYADPTEDLTPQELERANARARFVRGDCETLEPDGLARRIRGVSASGVKATVWLYSRYAGADLAMNYPAYSRSHGGRKSHPTCKRGSSHDLRRIVRLGGSSAESRPADDRRCGSSGLVRTSGVETAAVFVLRVLLPREGASCQGRRAVHRTQSEP
jgi:hypothetical protein